MMHPRRRWPFKSMINMYERAGADRTGVKLRDANWLSGEIEQQPCERMGKKNTQSDADNNTNTHMMHHISDQSELISYQSALLTYGESL